MISATLTMAFVLLIVQGVLGAFDTFWNHEWHEKLHKRPTAYAEVGLHAAREGIYGIIYLVLAISRPEGLCAMALLALLVIEILITLTDFVIEDMTRKLPAVERVTHTVLAINYGAILALLLPELWAWTGRANTLQPVDYGWLSWSMMALGAGAGIWAFRDLWAFADLARRQAPEWQRRPIRRGINRVSRHVLVTGATGFIGGHLVRQMIERGDIVTVWTRSADIALDRFGPHVRIVTRLSELGCDTKIDAIVNLAGAPLAAGRWTRRRKLHLMNSRVKTTKALAAFVSRLKRRPKVLINGSAIGFYGGTGDHQVSETDVHGSGFAADICRGWECAAGKFEDYGVRVVLLRMGLVLGRSGGVLPSLTLPTHFGIATVFGSGRQWLSWIHLVDLIALIFETLDNREYKGAVNAVAPGPVRQGDFASALGRVADAPLKAGAPAWLLKTMLGEMSALMLQSNRVLPRFAEARGFAFRYPDVTAALEDLVVKQKTDAISPSAVYYNRACPVCRTEINHYRERQTGQSKLMTYVDVSTIPGALSRFGLSPEDARRRLYVIDQCGKLYGGTNAIRLIWAETPGYAWLARITNYRAIRFIAAAIYDGLCVPLLWRFNRNRGDRRISVARTRAKEI